jgi:hypothetical protein
MYIHIFQHKKITHNASFEVYIQIFKFYDKYYFVTSILK